MSINDNCPPGTVPDNTGMGCIPEPKVRGQNTNSSLMKRAYSCGDGSNAYSCGDMDGCPAGMYMDEFGNCVSNRKRNSARRECLTHRMPDGTLMNGAPHGPGQVCVEWSDNNMNTMGGRNGGYREMNNRNRRNQPMNNFGNPYAEIDYTNPNNPGTCACDPYYHHGVYLGCSHPSTTIDNCGPGFEPMCNCVNPRPYEPNCGYSDDGGCLTGNTCTCVGGGIIQGGNTGNNRHDRMMQNLARQFNGRFIKGNTQGNNSIMTWKLDCGDAGTVDGISDSDAPGHWTNGGTQSYGDIDCTTIHY